MSLPDATTQALVDPEWENFFSRRSVVVQESLERMLGRIPVFSLLRAKELRALARLVHVRHFELGEVVIRCGVAQSGLYLIRSGSVHIVRDAPDGSRQVVGTLGPPELLGEFALLDDTPRSTSIIAAEASELIGFFKPDLTDILATNPGMGCMIVLRLGEEMVATLNRDYAQLRELGWPFAAGRDGPETIDPTA